jgi:endo-1,4-beta-mannosidase
VYIVRRYRNEPAILAWDVRNEGDIDYGAQSSDHKLFSQEEVIKWLEHITQVVRENDPNHLVTAGWWGDPLVTSPYVDFLSFHQFDSFDIQKLQNRIEQYRRGSGQPLVLQEVGYHSWAEAPDGPRDESTQAEILGRVANAVEETEISGWVVWTAFDFVLAPGQPANYEHFFGLWRTDLTPKPVLEVLPLQ